MELKTESKVIFSMIYQLYKISLLFYKLVKFILNLTTVKNFQDIEFWADFYYVINKKSL